MKTITTPNTLLRGRKMTTLALNLSLFAGLSALPLYAQDRTTTSSGQTEEEWYGPSGGFDGDNTEDSRFNRSGNDGWSDAMENRSNSSAYNQNRNSGTTTQAERNQRNQQTRRNQQSDRSDLQSNRRNQQSDRSNLQRDRSDQTTQRSQQRDRTSQNAQRNQQDGWSDQNTQSSQQRDRSDYNQQTNRNQNQNMRKASLNGEIDGFKSVEVMDSNGQTDEQTFIRVRLDEGDARVVSLGSRLILTDLDLEKGDQISISGRNARIDDQNVLVASSIEVDDTLFRVREDNRPETKQNRSNSKHNRMDKGENVSVNGTVKQSSKTSLSNDSREENLLVRLELKDGKSCVVDLGQDMSMGDLDIENGSEISIQGKKTKIDGKSLIVARKISVDGESTRLRNKSHDMKSDHMKSKGSWEKSDRNNRNSRDNRNRNSRDSRYDSLDPVSQN